MADSWWPMADGWKWTRSPYIATETENVSIEYTAFVTMSDLGEFFIRFDIDFFKFHDAISVTPLTK